jgi:MinD superfamily P-loop ATPase
MERVVQLASHFSVPAMLCVNKFDINLEMTREIESYAQKKGLPCLGRIPFDPIFTKAMVQCQTVFEYNTASPASLAVNKIWKAILQVV